MHYPYILEGQHHGILFGSGLIRIDFGMSRIMMPCQIYCLLAYGIGDRGIHLAFHSQIYDLIYILEGGLSCILVYLSDFKLIDVSIVKVQHIYGSKAV